MLDNGYFYELHHFIDLFCECCVNRVEPELGLVWRRNKIQSTVRFPSQLSVYRASRAAHICLGRAGPRWAEESTGRRDCKLHRKTHFRPQSWPQHSSVKVRAGFPHCVVVFRMRGSIHSQCASSSTVGCTRRPPSRTCRWMQMKARLLSWSSSAPLLMDATRNCLQADGKVGRKAILPAAGHQLKRLKSPFF